MWLESESVSIRKVNAHCHSHMSSQPVGISFPIYLQKVKVSKQYFLESESVCSCEGWEAYCHSHLSSRPLPLSAHLSTRLSLVSRGASNANKGSLQKRKRENLVVLLAQFSTALGGMYKKWNILGKSLKK